MSIIVDDKFYDSIPKEIKTRTITRINKLVQELKSNHQLVQRLSKGFYCRQVKGVKNRYKFRVSNGDRIVFCYQNGHEDICLLRYCNHDNQISTAKNIAATPLKIVDTSYQENAFDKEIDQEILKEYQENLLKDDLKGAYDIANNKPGMKQKAKFLRGAMEIDAIAKAYRRNKAGSSGITFYTGEKAYLTEQVLLHVYNKIYSEYRLIPTSYVEVSFPGDSFFSNDAHFLDMPFFAVKANLEDDSKQYIRTFVNEIYQQFGLIRNDFNFTLEFLFRDVDNHLIPKSFEYYIPSDMLKEIRAVTMVSEDHSGRKNAYIHALSLTSPDKIGRFNYRYLFKDK